MEKLRIANQKQFSNRLLKNIFRFCIVAMLFASSVAFSITPAEIAKITIHPEQNVFFTNQELKYVLEIPEVHPYEVQTQLQETRKEGINFISSRRMEFFTEDNKTGTRIEFWFSFKESGIAVLPPLIVMIKGRTYYLNFDNVQLYENPKTIAPFFIVELNNSKTIYPILDKQTKRETFVSEVAQPIELTIYVQYAVQIKQFGYEIPKDSLFEELERYDMATGKIKYNDFMQNKIPVVKFKWIPLKEGNFSLPNIGAVVSAYSGRSLELGLPECLVQIRAKTEVVSDKNAPTEFATFAYALSEPLSEDNEKEFRTATQEDFIEIVQLRSKERKSFGPSPSIRKQRIELEQSIGIVASRDEPSVPLWYTSVVLLVIFISITIICFVFKKKVFSVFSLAISIIFAFLTLFLSFLVFEKHAVVKGGAISPVPEESALSSTVVTAGTCVRIREETPQWYYVEYNENGGWMKKVDLLLID